MKGMYYTKVPFGIKCTVCHLQTNMYSTQPALKKYIELLFVNIGQFALDFVKLKSILLDRLCRNYSRF